MGFSHYSSLVAFHCVIDFLKTRIRVPPTYVVSDSSGIQRPEEGKGHLIMYIYMGPFLEPD